MTHLWPTPTEPFPPWLQSNQSGLPLMGRRAPARAAAPFQALQGSSSALPFPWPPLGADLQTVQGWALPKQQWDERDRSKAKIKGGQEAEQSTPPSHLSCFLPGLSSALSSPNTSRDLPMWLFLSTGIYVCAAYLHNCCTLFSLQSSILWIFPAAEAIK